MESLIIIVHVIAAIALTMLVLLQRGKGAEMGASFGSGASQTLFGSSGSGNVLTKSTTIFATVFFITSLSLAVIARQAADTDRLGGTLIENAEQLQADLSTTEAARQTGRDEDMPLVDSENDIPLAPE
jgi:preprotein translocase subunit SecG